MNLKLVRFNYELKGTPGLVFVNDKRVSFTLERPWLNNQSYVSCVPEGTYAVRWGRSPKFGMALHILDVPDRDHVLFHHGNWIVNSLGCVLLGTGLRSPLTEDKPLMVTNSKPARKAFEAIVAPYKTGTLEITSLMPLVS